MVKWNEKPGDTGSYSKYPGNTIKNCRKIIVILTWKYIYYCRLALHRWVLIIFMTFVINRKQCSGFFTDLSDSPYEYSNKNIKSTIQIKPEIK